MKDRIINFIGSLIRDIIVQFQGEEVEYRISNGKFVYKSWIPKIFSIGQYVFLPKKDFYNFLLNNFNKSKIFL